MSLEEGQHTKTEEVRGLSERELRWRIFSFAYDTLSSTDREAEIIQALNDRVAAGDVSKRLGAMRLINFLKDPNNTDNSLAQRMQAINAELRLGEVTFTPLIRVSGSTINGIVNTGRNYRERLSEVDHNIDVVYDTARRLRSGISQNGVLSYTRHNGALIPQVVATDELGGGERAIFYHEYSSGSYGVDLPVVDEIEVGNYKEAKYGIEVANELNNRLIKVIDVFDGAESRSSHAVERLSDYGVSCDIEAALVTLVSQGEIFCNIQGGRVILNARDERLEDGKMCPSGKFKCIVKHTAKLNLVTREGESYECDSSLVMAIVIHNQPTNTDEVMEATLLNLLTIMPTTLPEPTFAVTGFPVMPLNVLLPDFSKPVMLIPGKDAMPETAKFAEDDLNKELRETFQWSNLKIKGIEDLIRDLNPYAVTKGGVEFEHVYMLKESSRETYDAALESGISAISGGDVNKMYKMLKENIGPSIAAKQIIQSPTFSGSNVKQFTVDDLIVRWTLSRMLLLTRKQNNKKIELTYSLSEKRAQMFGLPPSVTYSGIMFYSVDELLRESIGRRFRSVIKKLPNNFRALLSERKLPNNISGANYLFTVEAPLVEPRTDEPCIINYDGKIASVRHVVAEAIQKMRNNEINRMAVAWHPSFMITILLDTTTSHVLLDSSARGSSIAPTYHSPKRMKNLYSGGEIGYGDYAFKQLGRKLGYIGAHLNAPK
uniref:Uncharacterized protein n=1 Tax=viral metagenome TaxID=1070528 RepID=A0A2V0RAT2_9ZZZZ